MPILKVQFPHPGPQKKINLKNGYRNIGGRIIREWNNDINHYRKFILNNGEYLNGINDPFPKNSDLFFWGEWEGNSLFTPMINSDYRILPNGVHKPFHSIVIRGLQNTDPYVFGEYFKYCTCKQTGNLCNLSPNSIILFGSVYPSLGRFYIDTVFVVKNQVTATHVHRTGGVGYSQAYKEETLEQLTEYLGVAHLVTNQKLYKSQTWWDNKEFFSFVPCKLNHNGNGFERLAIALNNPLFQLSANPTGKSFLNNCNLSPQEVWKKITEISTEQGFQLGIRFAEPMISNVLDHFQENPNTHLK
jgi:hypothetical protein